MSLVTQPYSGLSTDITFCLARLVSPSLAPTNVSPRVESGLDRDPLRLVRGVDVEIWVLVGKRRAGASFARGGLQLRDDLARFDHGNQPRGGLREPARARWPASGVRHRENVGQLLLSRSGLASASAVERRSAADRAMRCGRCRAVRCR
jgi:hypothetical protein